MCVPERDRERERERERERVCVCVCARARVHVRVWAFLCAMCAVRACVCMASRRISHMQWLVSLLHRQQHAVVRAVRAENPTASAAMMLHTHTVAAVVAD